MKQKNKLDFKEKSIFLEALEHPLPYFPNRAMPGRDLSQLNSSEYKNHRKSSVLLLVGFVDGNGTPPEKMNFLFTKRSEKLKHHAGEVSFPGGALSTEHQEPLTHRHFYESALREAWEEVGIENKDVEILGHLPPLYTLSSNFLMVPVVGFLKSPISTYPFVIEKNEVEEVFWVSYSELMLQHNQKFEEYKRHEKILRTPLYLFENKKIWGATGIILHNFMERILKVKV